MVVAVGVVMRIHRGQGTVAGRRHRRAEAVVVVAVDARAVVVADARRHRDDHPALAARTVPVEVDGLEVFEGGEAVELVAQLVVGHDGEGVPSVDAVQRDVDLDSLDATGIYSDVFLGVAVDQGEFRWVASGCFCCDGSYYQQDAHQDVLGFHSW